MAAKFETLVDKEFFSLATGFYYRGFREGFLAQTLPSELMFRQLKFVGSKYQALIKNQKCSQMYGILDFQLKRIFQLIRRKFAGRPVLVSGDLAEFELVRESVARYRKGQGPELDIRLAGAAGLAVDESNTIKVAGLAGLCEWIETNKSIYDSLGVDLVQPSFERNIAGAFP